MSARAWAILGILILVQVLNTLDRYVPIIVAESVKTEFGLSDAELGLFTGLAYGLSYALVGYISGPIIDRYNRSRLLAGMLMLWSGLTALGGVATSYYHLLAARFAVGATEAGCTPASLAILSDVFPTARRGTAIGLLKMGGPIGLFAASLIGGHIASAYGWRAAFLAAGIPGLLVAFIVMRWVPEPPRGALDRAPGEADPAPMPIREVARVILRAPGIGLTIVGLMLYGLANAGAQAFIVPFMQRLHGMSLPEAASWFALATGLGGAGPLILGLVNDRITRRGMQYNAYCAAIIGLISLVAGLTMATTSSVAILVVMMILWQTMALGITTVNYAALLTLTPPAMRGTIIAVILSSAILIAIGVAPVVTGLLSDLLGGGEALRPAIIIMISLNLVVILAYWMAGRQLARRRDGG